MSKRKKTTTARPLLVALALVLVGLIGLLLATVKTPDEQSSATNSALKVITGQSQQAVQSREGAASQLQGAAQIKDFNTNQDSATVQQGGDIDTLLRDKQIQ